MTASHVATNLIPFQRSRKPPRAGDIFTFHIGEEYYFGRVISADAQWGFSVAGAILVYLYRTSSATPEPPPRACLSISNLLVPPIMTNRLVWSRGYFKHIRNEDLQGGDVLPAHCFRSSEGRYYDERAKLLDSPVEPCGDWGLHSFRTIDDQVSDALGIARMP